MFIYLFWQLSWLEEKMRMWTAGEEVAEYRFHYSVFDGIQKTNKVELEKEKKNVSLHGQIHNS